MYTHFTFTLMAHCTSGAIRGSVSCSRTLRQGIELATSNLLITKLLLYLLCHCRHTHTFSLSLCLCVSVCACVCVCVCVCSCISGTDSTVCFAAISACYVVSSSSSFFQSISVCMFFPSSPWP